MKDWAIANAKTSDTEGYQHGERSGRLTITFDAVILEQSETTS